MFFDFSQNNSGGDFDYDAERGISCHVIIEADSPSDASEKAEAIGLYFDGAGDCSCCGDRWYPQWNDDKGDETPSIYGKPIGEYESIITWMTGGKANAFVHFKNGNVVGHLPG